MFRKLPLSQALFVVAVALTLFGLLMIFSASSVQALSVKDDGLYYFKKQLLSAFLGLGALLFFSWLPYRRLRAVSGVMLGVTVVFLILVLIPGLGVMSGGARRWLQLGPIGFQPSELAKLAVILFGATVLSGRREQITSLAQALNPAGWLVLVIVLLVILEPDFGTAITIAAAFGLILYLVGLPIRQLAAIGAGVVGAGLLVVRLEQYRWERLLSWMDPWGRREEGGFQIIQSLIAFGSGGVTGQGFGESRQKFFYLPQSFSDFIFAIVGEELGLIGALAVIVLFLALAYFGVRIALRSQDQFGRLVAAGLTGTICAQAFLNMAAVTGLLPVTGIPLPFISSGGSALIVQLSAIGILMSIGSTRRMEVLSEGRDLRRRDSRARPARARPGRRTQSARSRS